ncbi:MAG: ParB/RepB/Spo0J family partition protein [Ruminococcaceae bacterium]|nr:ParB/RepB/Spo0J family partition protein [Oscillospiraceae bacterium]
MAKKMGGLGKGLSAIFIENDSENSNEAVTLRISDIEPNRDQPRKDFDEAALAELSQSIMQFGVLQPILVRPLIEGGYQIVAGERRYRASRMAGLTEIPAVIRELSDNETMELALIENLQREDLTPIEEAKGYKTLIDTYSMSQEQVAQTVGKSRPAIANTMRLLFLPDDVIELVEKGTISGGHARALLSLDNKALMSAVAEEVVKKELSVRQVEKLVKDLTKKPTSRTRTAKSKPSYFAEVELALTEYLGNKVVVTPSKDGKGGTLSIDFYSLEELKDLANKLEDNK